MREERKTKLGRSASAMLLGKSESSRKLNRTLLGSAGASTLSLPPLSTAAGAVVEGNAFDLLRPKEPRPADFAVSDSLAASNRNKQSKPTFTKPKSSIFTCPSPVTSFKVAPKDLIAHIRSKEAEKSRKVVRLILWKVIFKIIFAAVYFLF
jgi:hypothetical protein